jgi:hypothetical protein
MNVFALHRQGYGPSERAKNWLGLDVIPVAVADSDDIHDELCAEVGDGMKG